MQPADDGLWTNKLSVQHGQGTKTPYKTRNTTGDSTSTFTCMKTPFTHSYVKCHALSLPPAQVTPATVSVILQICAGQTTKVPTANQHCPVSYLQVLLEYVDTFWNSFFLNKNVLFLDHLTTKKAPWFLEMWGNIQRHIVITQKRLEHLAHWLWEPQISQKMLSLFLVQNGMEHHLNFERLRYSEIFISKCLCC